jgi:seryl-tRNA synthetase
VNWTLAELRKRGFVLLSTPDLARSSVVEKCGFQPRGSNTQVYITLFNIFSVLSSRLCIIPRWACKSISLHAQVYSVEGTDLCLAGTSEILIGGLYMDSMLPEASLPLRLVAFSHCFRTEAGAAGSATRCRHFPYCY